MQENMECLAVAIDELQTDSVSEVMGCTRYQDHECEYYDAEKTVGVGLTDSWTRDLS
jgi:hypothetical protein